MFGRFRKGRKYKRYGGELEASYALGGSHSAVGFRKCYVDNISAGGAHVRTDDPMELGREYQLIIHSPVEDQLPIHATVEIVREETSENGLHHYGAIFKDLAEKDKKRLSI